MKVRLLAPWSIGILFAFLTLPSSFAQTIVNPQIGVSASLLSTDPDSLQSSARFGYQVGLSVRFGESFYIQPGLYWQRSSTELRDEFPSPEELNESIDLDAILASVHIGYYLLNTDPLNLRIQAGLNGTSIINVENTEFDEIVDFNTILLGAPVGVGVDLFGFLSADITYEFGLTSLFDQVFGLDVDVTNNVFRFNVGLLF